MKPFNVEEALSGKPVQLKNGRKALIVFNAFKLPYEIDHDYPLLGYLFNEKGHILNPLNWTLQGIYNLNDMNNSDFDIAGMYEEPRPTVTLTLPCPLKEPQEEMWFISEEFNVYKSSYSEKCITNLSNDWFSQGRYFASEEDARAWVDAMKNNRR